MADKTLREEFYEKAKRIDFGDDNACPICKKGNIIHNPLSDTNNDFICSQCKYEVIITKQVDFKEFLKSL